MKTNQLSLSELEMEKEKNLFVLNQDKMIEFIPLKSQLKRKNLTGKQCRENLLKILKHLKNLKLTPGEVYILILNTKRVQIDLLCFTKVMKHNVFSKKPFEKLLSYELITAVKHNDMTSCIELLQKNKYIVYDFDYVSFSDKSFKKTYLFWCLDLHDGLALELQKRSCKTQLIID